jgi:SagB-type dehydrogenase family enzyme
MIELGSFSAPAAKRAHALSEGLPLASLATGSAIAKELDVLVQRLARRGLVEYRLSCGDTDAVVIEPQTADYWPTMPKLAASDAVALSRFAYLRRRGSDMVLESPRAGALFRICDPAIAATLTGLVTPQKIGKLRGAHGFPGLELFALLVGCDMLFATNAAQDDNLRLSEGDEHLVLWDFHDFLFHARSTEGRQANPIGGLYPYADMMAPPAAVRSPWPGDPIDLKPFAPASAEPPSPYAKLLSERHSTREFDDTHPITLADLALFMDRTARVRSHWTSELDFGGGGPEIAYTGRPYPAAGSAYELELYLAVSNCEGLERGFYHYDADRHALVAIDARVPEFDALLHSAEYAMDTQAPPQILIMIAARFDRISWKYSAIAYALILKDVGVLIQSLYMTATEMGLGGCAIGTGNIDLFAKITGLDIHVEGPVGQFALGRGVKSS